MILVSHSSATHTLAEVARRSAVVVALEMFVVAFWFAYYRELLVILV